MATKTIGTWEEFKAAWTEDITESTTYIITNDIDVSDTVIDSSLNCPATLLTHRVKTFTTNGNNINIIGLTKYNSGTLFNVSGEYGIVVFNNINFINCQITLGSLFGVNGTNRCISIINSVITGYIYTINTRFTYENYVFYYYKNCAVNTKGARTIGDYSYVVECWVHFDALSTGASNQALLQHGKICQTYYEGSVTNSGPVFNTTSLYNVVSNITASAAGSTNIEFYSSTYNKLIPSLLTSNTPQYTAPYGNTTCLINSDKLTQYNTTNFVALTDSQLKSVTAINELAPGFPISD